MMFQTLHNMSDLANLITRALDLLQLHDLNKLQVVLSKNGYIIDRNSKSHQRACMKQLVDTLTRENNKTYIANLCQWFEQQPYITKDITIGIRNILNPPTKLMPSALTISSLNTKPTKLSSADLENKMKLYEEQITQLTQNVTDLKQSNEDMLLQNKEVLGQLQQKQNDFDDQFNNLLSVYRFIKKEQNEVQLTQSQMCEQIQQIFVQKISDFDKHICETEMLRQQITQISKCCGQQQSPAQILSIINYIQKLESTVRSTTDISQRLSDVTKTKTHVQYELEQTKQQLRDAQLDTENNQVLAGKLQSQESIQIILDETLNENKELKQIQQKQKMILIERDSKISKQTQENKAIKAELQQQQDSTLNLKKQLQANDYELDTLRKQIREMKPVSMNEINLKNEVDRLNQLLHDKWELLQNWDKGFAVQDDQQ